MYNTIACPTREFKTASDFRLALSLYNFSIFHSFQFTMAVVTDGNRDLTAGQWRLKQVKKTQWVCWIDGWLHVCNQVCIEVLKLSVNELPGWGEIHTRKGTQ